MTVLTIPPISSSVFYDEVRRHLVLMYGGEWAVYPRRLPEPDCGFVCVMHHRHAGGVVTSAEVRVDDASVGEALDCVYAAARSLVPESIIKDLEYAEQFEYFAGL
jgi:hypothetical protein